MGRYVLTLVVFQILSGCQKDPQVGPVDPTVKNTANLSGRRLVIGNEGNFQYNNSSITVYSLETGEVTQEVYRSANGEGVGDVLQDMVAFDGKVLVSVNNSGKVLILNDSSWSEEGRIEGLNSPRRLYNQDPSTLWVTDLYGNEVTRIDLSEEKVTGKLEFDGWSEGITQIDEEVWIANMTDSSLNRYDLGISERNLYIQMDFEPRFIDTTQFHVYVAGNAAGTGYLTAWLSSWVYPASLSESVSGMDGFRGWSYVLTPHRVEIYDIDLNRIGGFDHSASSPYSIYVNKDGVFIADVKDFITRGEVLFYNHQYELVDRIPAGYVPQCMLAL